MTSGETVRQYNGHHKGKSHVKFHEDSHELLNVQLLCAVRCMMAQGKVFPGYEFAGGREGLSRRIF